VRCVLGCVVGGRRRLARYLFADLVDRVVQVCREKNAGNGGLEHWHSCVRVAWCLCVKICRIKSNG